MTRPSVAHRAHLVLPAALLLLLAAACTKVETSDPTPPTAEILFQQPNNQFEVAATANLGSDPLDVIGRAEDTSGIRSVRLEFHNTVATSCTVGGTVYNGSFTIPLPGPFELSPTVNASGQVLSQAGIPAEILRPTCTVYGPSGPMTGTPFGHVIEVVCTAKNWSSNAQTSTAVTTAEVTIGSGYSG